MTERGWAVHLDELVAACAQQRWLIDARRYDEVVVPDLQPSPELEALPPHFAGRAAEVVEELRRLTHALAQAQAEVSSELRRLRRPVASGGRSATYVDGYA